MGKSNGTQDQTNLVMCCNHLSQANSRWLIPREWSRLSGFNPWDATPVRPIRQKDLVSYIQQEFPWLRELASQIQSTFPRESSNPLPRVAVGMESKAQLMQEGHQWGRSAQDLLVQYSVQETERTGIIHFGQGSGG